MKVKQLRMMGDEILHYLHPEIPYSIDARELLILTCATETGGGEYVRQIGFEENDSLGGFGIFQMEIATEKDITEYTAVEQSCIGTTIDYYLSPQKRNDDLIFNYTARLEVSGILVENEDNTVDNRIKQKVKRLKPEGDLPDLIAIVEFSKPWSKIIKV
jgi:hypothetical protein